MSRKLLSGGVTKNQAVWAGLHWGGAEFEYLHETYSRSGKLKRVRTNGKAQTWKTRPNDFRLPYKYGMYDYGNITQDNAADFQLAPEYLAIYERDTLQKNPRIRSHTVDLGYWGDNYTLTDYDGKTAIGKIKVTGTRLTPNSHISNAQHILLVTLDNGAQYVGWSAGKHMAVTGRPKAQSMRKNPAEIHVDINSHNAARSRGVKTNPIDTKNLTPFAKWYYEKYGYLPSSQAVDDFEKNGTWMQGKYRAYPEFYLHQKKRSRGVKTNPIDYDKPYYEVIVGNVGKVHEGNSKNAALKVYNEYVALSKRGYGRVAGEGVDLYDSGNDIIKTYEGTMQENPSFAVAKRRFKLKRYPQRLQQKKRRIASPSVKKRLVRHTISAIAYKVNVIYKGKIQRVAAFKNKTYAIAYAKALKRAYPTKTISVSK
jgi:hypothetical protein